MVLFVVQERVRCGEEMSNIWREPIFDRTAVDVGKAISKINEWKQNHTHWADVAIDYEKVSINEGYVKTTADSVILECDGAVYVEDESLVIQLGVVYDLKGCLNISDLTRIEDNVSYLADMLTQYRYPIVVSSKKWVKTDLPNANDMKRIAKNIRNIIDGFATPLESVDIPETLVTYQDINNLERNLYLLKEMLDAMESCFIPSGTYISGATNRLPIRR